MIKKCLVAVLACLVWSGAALASASAEEVSLDDVVRALERPFRAEPGAAGIADFEAEFIQESRIVSLDRSQRGNGQVWFKFGGVSAEGMPLAKFRWEYRRPSEQVMVSDGKILWVYLPENNQVIESDLEYALREQPENPVSFLTGLGNLSRDFSIRWAAPRHDSGGNFVLELEPRRVSELIARLVIVVDQKAVTAKDAAQVFPILSTSVSDPSGNLTTIEFRSVRINRNPAASVFEFTPPEGVDLVRPGSAAGF
jgi:outer membrane lipoprotein carrier protein